ncbi:hypothetical protein M0R04_04040 [Candidatus Dojkabacteria bacterium]|nr:hypothetical protein [Candidatus Dojkabacteria bacterium]
MTVDKKWLNDKDRVYPITIDPTIVHDTTSEFSTGQFNRVTDTGSGSSPSIETYYKELPTDINTVGLWHFNEASGNALDSSGNSLTGTPTGTTIVSGKFGNARSFAGSGNYITLGSSSILNPISSMSFEAWVNFTSIPGETWVIGRDASGVRAYAFGPSASYSNRLELQINGTAVIRDIPGTEMLIGQWYHIAFTGSSSAGWNVYVNGQLAATATWVAPAAVAENTYIGRRGYASAEGYVNGIIDEVKISNIARTPEEIKLDAQRRPYSIYTSDIIDLAKVISWNNLSWSENGVNTTDGETLFSSTNLIAQWNFNNTSNTTTLTNDAGSCSTTCNGTLSGFGTGSSGQDILAGSGWTANNRRWGVGALMLDGTDDSVLVTDNASIKPTSAITTEAWVNPNKTGSSVILDKRYDTTADPWNSYVLDITSTNQWDFCISNGTAGSQSCVTSAEIVQLGVWSHIVGTYDGSNIRLYVNGKQVSSTAKTGSIGYSTIGLYFGQNGYSGYPQYFGGGIDSTRIYSRALTAAEVLSNYQVGNIEFQTRVGASATPDDGSWDDWVPTTSEVAIDSFDSDPDNWSWQGNIGLSDINTVFPKTEGTSSLKISNTLKKVDWNGLGLEGGVGEFYWVNAIAIDANNNVYVGSNNGIIYWNGTSWNTMGAGVNGTVSAIAISGSNVYAGGAFTEAGENSNVNRIAYWNGSTWNALGSGVNNTVSAIAISGSNVYVGGTFTLAGGVTNTARIAYWNGSTWNAMGTGANGDVKAIDISGSNIYVAGNFTLAGGVTNTKYIAYWNGSAWNAMGTGANGGVYAIDISGSNIYIGGTFSLAGGVTNTARIAYWNGSAWNAMGTGANGSVYTIAISGSNVYIGGSFSLAGGITNTVRVAYWNGSAWNAMGTGANEEVHAIAILGSNIYMGGYFTIAGGVANTRYITYWNGSVWNNFGGIKKGVNGLVRAIAISGSNVYVGGGFTLAGGVTNTAYIAYWNGSTWNAMGTGANSIVYAIAISGSNIYVAGNFTLAGGVTNTKYIAYWNGSTWNAMGTGANAYVSAIAISGSNIYIGGNFTLAGGVTNTARIAYWNGSAWNAMGTGANGAVSAIAISGSNIYIGGAFTLAGGVTNTVRVAYWNGSAWNAMGTGANGTVSALAISGSNIYAGGSFSLAGGVTNTVRIAYWNGSAWNAMGTGADSSVTAIAISGTNIYVVGMFTNMGGVTNTSGIAYWNGTVWNAVGYRLTSSVYAIAISSPNIYIGGYLQMPLGYIGVWNLNTTAGYEPKYTTGYWSFDETGGTGAYLKDYSEAGNNATPTGTTIVNGFTGKARSFGGTSSDYITVTDNANLGSTLMTVEGWVYPRSFIGGAPLYNRRTAGNVGGVSVELNGTTGSVNCYFYISGSWSVAASTSLLSPNKWNHLACTYDGSTIKPYINGVLDATTTAISGTINIPTSPIVLIGQNIPTPSNTWDGYIDEVRISNVARSANQIAETYRAGSNHYISKTITSTDLSSKISLPFYIAADRPGTYLSATVGESEFANYQLDTNTIGLWHLDDNATISATGGTITYSGGYTIHTFTTDGTFTSLGITNVEILVVAGGGGGGGGISGWGGSGGGGAGGIVYNSTFPVTATSYGVTVGNGGTGGTGGYRGNNGQDSIFSTITATGGGGGGSTTDTQSQQNGANGGCGGGAGGSRGITGGTGSQGYNGGGSSDVSPYLGAAGGGMGQIGGNGGNGTGKGGDGLAYSISGTSTYYAGGGAGGRGGTPGAGGGGADYGGNGTANTGGGGGGVSSTGTTTGGTGGSGIIIVRYPIASSSIKDSSNNGNNGSTGGTPTFSQGKIGNARSFNGSSDYIDIPTNTNLNSTNITVSTWVTSGATTALNTAVSRFDQTNNNWVLGHGSSASTYRFAIYVSGTQYNAQAPTAFFSLNQWHYLTGTYDGTNVKLYVDGVLAVTTAISGSLDTDAAALRIGNRAAPSPYYWSGAIDEVRIDNTARTADQIRQAFEIGARTHPITIDFGAKLDSGNLITNTSDLGFTVDATYYGLSSMGSNLYLGDKIIVKENYDGTEYISQGTVSTITPSTGATTVAIWDAGSTVPSGGFTVNASVFKWQREYFDIHNILSTQKDGITNITLRLTDGNEGRTIWLDDLKSTSGYMSTAAGTAITSGIDNKYFQYRAITTSSDTNVSPNFTSVTTDFVPNVPPDVPSFGSPANATSGVTLPLAMTTSATDTNSDDLQYKIILCLNKEMTIACQTIDQTLDQTGWSGQDAGGGTTYIVGHTATYTISNLTFGQTYFWKTYAIDPEGSNTWSETQTTPRYFTVNATSRENGFETTTMYSARRVSEQATTSSNWTDLGGTADTGTTGSTNGWISSSNLTVGKQYLILATGSHSTDNASGKSGLRVVHGTTSFTHSESIDQTDQTNASYKQPYFWFTVWTAVSGESLDVQQYWNGTGGQGRAEDISLLAIDATDLIANGDLKYNEDATSTTLTTSYQTTATTTFTPANNNDVWWIMGYNHTTLNTGSGALFHNHILINGSAYSESQITIVGSSLSPVVSLGYVTNLANSSNTISMQAKETSVTQTSQASGIYALRLNTFEDFYASNNTVGPTMSSPGGWETQFTGTPFNKKSSNKWVVMGGGTVNDNGGRVIARLMENSTSITDDMGGWENGTGDKTPLVLADLDIGVGSGYRNIIFDAQTTLSGTSSINYPWLVSFSTEKYPNYTSMDAPSNAATMVALRPDIKMTAIDPDSGNHLMYKIQICDDFAMTVSCSFKDQTSSQTGWSGQNADGNTTYTSGTQATYIPPANLSGGYTYYWRAYSIDPAGTATFTQTNPVPYSFTTSIAPTAPTALLAEGLTSPTQVLDLTPEFSSIFNDPDTGDTSANYQIQVNTQSDFLGTSMWDSGKHSMTVANGARGTDVSYAGTALGYGGDKYYWRMKYWDVADNASAWSTAADFTLKLIEPSMGCHLVKSLDSTSLTLVWRDVTTLEDGYQIQRKVDSGSFANLILKAIDSTTHTDSTISFGHTYTYRVAPTSNSEYGVWCTTTPAAVFQGGISFEGIEFGP